MSSKTKITFSCSNCGAKYPKWLGQCKVCGEWNTISEEIVNTKNKNDYKFISKTKAVDINDINYSNDQRIFFSENEINRVLGGGLVKGSVVLISGEPGIGKSTILLQNSLSSSEKVLYISGEESSSQIKLRAHRITNNLKNCFILTETNLELILKNIEEIKPDILIIDSIQTIQTDIHESSQGSLTQIRECTGILIKLAKNTGLPIIIVGHITKEGSIAGPKILEHMVDVVLHFEGDKQNQYRILRSKKNRFGSTDEIGIYQMNSNGLNEVSDPSELFISKKEKKSSGSAVSVTLDGSRSLMIEIQALVSSAVYGIPQRISNGFNSKRLNMLLAILEKRAGFKIGIKDVFINVTGGFKIEDTATDLAVICAILSSNINLAIDQHSCFCAEVDLSGELRSVSSIEKRVNEAQRLGYKNIYISSDIKQDFNSTKINVTKLSNVKEVVKSIFKEQG
tara:strand:- start:108 stop:1466 length:1359 start_codon:yes stop_codon:yes gene_type:complete